MKCSKCGRENPADSEFCQYCGASLTVETNKPENYFQESATPEPENYFTVPVEKKPNSLKVPLIAVILLAAVLAILNVVQFSQNTGSQDTINALTNQVNELSSKGSNTDALLEEKDNALSERDAVISDKDAQITKLNTDIQKLEAKAFEMEANARRYEIICEEFDPDETYGYASSGFKVSDGIVVLRKGGNKKRITLTADFDGYVQIDSHVSGLSADVIWNEDEWSGSTTTLDVVSSKNATGVTTIRFTNDRNNKSFKVFVIVIS